MKPCPRTCGVSITQDLENWSVWHTYEYADGLAGIQIRSPSPRQYVQLHIAFFSARLAGGQIDSLFFEFSQPPVVSEAIGEIYPPFVESADPVRFTYMVRTRLEAEQSGFNVLEVRTARPFGGHPRGTQSTAKWSILLRASIRQIPTSSPSNLIALTKTRRC